MTKQQTWKLICSAFHKRGGLKYMISEPITQEQHALQSYMWMKTFSQNHHLRVAALLHDIGHLLDRPVDPSTGVNDHHEIVGASWLRAHHFPKSVYVPVELHVQAKRFRCKNIVGYKSSLSKGSILSLDLQGEEMTEDEENSFLAHPYSQEALLLRDADDSGKEMGVHDLPELESLEDDVMDSVGSNDPESRPTE